MIEVFKNCPSFEKWVLEVLDKEHEYENNL